jgi:alkanesulfonate monooxygenase SsuD/methylene tetrahydromethanopterin reductase-like flavin-dependent oxidoreductase (luciferase family)
MNSPNLMAASAAQRTKRLKLLIYGNLLPVHQPLRLAEELAMLDCLSKGRLISGFARGIPREYQVHNIPLAESRARFEEAYDIITRAWTEEVFSYDGRFWSYHDVALWPRPVQQPHPPIWMPIVGSQESIEFAAAHNIPITPGLGRARGLRDDIIRHYAKCLSEAGHRITPCRSASPPMSPIQRLRRSRNTGRTSSISTAPCSATATSPRPRRSARAAIRLRPRPITCGRRICAPPPICARNSAT